MNRAGAALILALVLLAALLLLGLPFLYSQSASLSGTRSFADSRQAQIGRDSAESMASAVAAYAMTPALVATQPGVDPSAADSDLCRLAVDGPDTGPTLDKLKPAVLRLDEGHLRNADLDDGSIGLEPQGLGLGFNDPPALGTARQRTYLGALITDESGKLDPNNMGPQVWNALLAAVGIQDWDDNNLYTPPPYSADDDQLGQLAQTLAGVRFGQPLRRITNLEQLLLADPQRSQPGGPWTKLRHQLTRAELERLRPCLTLHNPHQGRGGLIDLGTVARVDVLINPISGARRDTLWLDCPSDDQQPLLGLGTLLVGEDLVTTGSIKAHQIAMINANDESKAELAIQGKSFFAPKPEKLAQAGSAVAIEAPAPLNVHQLPPKVRVALGLGASLVKPLDASAAPVVIDAEVRTIAALGQFPPPNPTPPPITLFDRTSPFVSATSTPVPYQALGGDLEFPPLGILSGGIFSIDAAATVTDALGRQTAQASRRDIVQAVPQEYLLERRWLTQGAMHALLAQRYGSHVQAWPVAYERRANDATPKRVMPDDHDLTIAAEMGNIAAKTGIVSRPLRELSTTPAVINAARPQDPYVQHLQLDWRVGFGASGRLDDANVLSATARQNGADFAAAPNDLPLEPLTPASSAPSLRPDGYHVTGVGELGYRLHGTVTGGAGPLENAGFLIERLTPVGASTMHEMDSRHLSLWVKPEKDWTPAGAGSGSAQDLYPLFETRIPTANLIAEAPLPPVSAGAQPPRAAPSTDSENYLGLFYDAKNEMLVTVLAPPSAPHSQDYSPMKGVNSLVGFDADNPLTLSVDERSDFFQTGIDLRPLCPAEPAPPVGAGFASGLWQPNRVLHCFKTPKGAAASYFRAGQWYHVQIALASDRPEGVDVILDGIVGRDAAKVDPTNPTPVKLGDHCVLPSLVLQSDLLPATTQALLRQPTIDVKAPFGLPVAAMLPPRGMVRIDDEYIRYDSLGANQLLGCQRGMRQNTFVTDTTDTGHNFPNSQGHTKGTLAAEGGYRLGLDGGRIYRGGCVVDQTVPAGSQPAMSYKVWANVDMIKIPPVGPTRTLPQATDIPITGGDAALFPKGGGIVVIDYGSPQYRYYASCDGATLKGVQVINLWNVVPDPGAGATKSPPSDLTWAVGVNPPPKVWLLSISANVAPGSPGGSTPLQAGRFAQSPLGAPFLMQLAEPAAGTRPGRIEWFKYHFILENKSGVTSSQAFFLNLDGYPYTPDGTVSGRGIARTDFYGKIGDSHLPALTDSFFPVDSIIAPVQTEIGNHGHWVATGDMVTMLPKALGPPAADLPFQNGIRFAASDGYPSSGGTAANPAADSKNEYFTFVDLLDPTVTGGDWNTPLNGAAYDLLCGNCWGGHDLSPGNADGSVSGVDEPRGYLPRIDLLAPGYTLGANSGAGVFFGSTDPNATVKIVSDCTVDGISAGALAKSSVGLRFDDHDRETGDWRRENTAAPGIVRFLRNGAAGEIVSLTENVSELPVIAEANLPIFEFGLGEMGLVDIDGEVFAYQRVPDADASALTSTLDLVEPHPGTPGPLWLRDEITGKVPPPDTALKAQYRGRFAKLIARGLLDLDAPTGATWQQHAILPATAGRAMLSAKRLPIGPVLQLDPATTAKMASAPTSTDWFHLTDGTFDAAGKPLSKILYAPAALFCKLDGDPANEELLQLIGPKHHLNPPAGDVDADGYATADWLRGLYGTSRIDWNSVEKSAIVIGWWPRYASALPPAGGPPITKEHFRSRTYAWVGLPFSLYGAYFDPDRIASLPPPFSGPPAMTLAQVAVDPTSLFTTGSSDFFEVDARALAYEEQWSGAPPSDAGSMDWSQQSAVAITGPGAKDPGDVFKAANDGARCFSDGTKARAVDGAELRITWRYTALATDLGGIANATGRSPVITSARLRCLAPVRVLATEHAR